MKTKVLFLLLLIGSLWLISSCKKDPVETSKDFITYDNTPYEFQYSYLPPPNLPEDNPLTIAGVQLGRMLFYEKRLSEDNSLACAGCHLQIDGFSDELQFSVGTQGLEGTRQAMSIVNLAWNTNGFFWDGRADLLRDQALMPIEDPLEMNELLENVVGKLTNDEMYRDQFKRAFNSEDITTEKMALALEQFMLSIVSVDSKYDKFLRGELFLSDPELHGMQTFFQEHNVGSQAHGGDCFHCHGGVNFQNNEYRNNGLDTDESMTDLGRYLVTGEDGNKGQFKVPTLRNIAKTAPYMHDGRFNTLQEVIEHYNEGVQPSSTLDPIMEITMETGLGMTELDISDLVSFLKTLTDNEFALDPRYDSPFEE